MQGRNIVPAHAEPVHGVNSTLVDGTTARTVLPAVTGKSYFITGIIVTNQTAAEDPVITVETSGATKIVDLSPGAPGTTNGGTIIRTFDPPLKLVAGQGVQAKAGSAVGDTTVHVNGWLA